MQQHAHHVASSSSLISIPLSPRQKEADPASILSYMDKSGKEMVVSMPYSVMNKPEVGPINPYSTKMVNKNILSGYVENTALNEYDFEEQRLLHRTAIHSLEQTGSSKKNLPKRKSMGDPGDIDSFRGPWARYEGEPERGTLYGATPDQMAQHEENKSVSRVEKISKDISWIEPGQERSIFHAKSERDYMGRSYMHPPTDVDGVDLLSDAVAECFVPKRLIHTWTGHSKGVTSCKFLPKTGHLLLSSSMDAKLKLWSVYGDRRVLRTFIGHNKAIRNICFREDGQQFISAAYDRYVKLWDTETGRCSASYTMKGSETLPYCATFHPSDPNIFLVGCSNKRIYQYDSRLGTDEDAIVQEYNEHMEGVNCVTFFDEGRRFVTASDDKTLRFWEYGIPVTIKTIAEPHLHAVSSIALHPNGRVFAMQSQDNQILTYTAGGSGRETIEDDTASFTEQSPVLSSDRFRNFKKRFAGHNTAGYACNVTFSPDGQFVVSGDSGGKVWLWHWKTGKIAKTFKAHDKVSIGCDWHPRETSKIATCSWDGTIKFWD